MEKQEKKKSWFKRHKVLIVVLCILLILITGITSSDKGEIMKISWDDIHSTETKIIIDFPDGYKAFHFRDSTTESMYLKNSYAIGLPVTNTTEINVRDIISFNISEGRRSKILLFGFIKVKTPEHMYINGSVMMVHRVVKKGIDDGEYYITKGDNARFQREKVRREDVDSVIAMIIY